MSTNRKLRRAMARNPDLSGKLEDVQNSLQRVQGLAAAPQLLQQIKDQLETAQRLTESLADDYYRTQQRLKVLEKMVRISLELGGYSGEMIKDLEKELEGET